MSKLRLTYVDLFLALAFAIACVFWGETASMNNDSEVYPRLVSGLLAVFAVISFLQERLASAEKITNGTLRSMLKPVIMIVGVIFYIFCIATVGYFVSTYTFLLIMFQSNRWGKDDEFLETKALVIDSIVCFFVTSLIALVFKMTLKLVFPESWLF
jgi:hypothetical protein